MTSHSQRPFVTLVLSCCRIFQMICSFARIFCWFSLKFCVDWNVTTTHSTVESLNLLTLSKLKPQNSQKLVYANKDKMGNYGSFRKSKILPYQLDIFARILFLPYLCYSHTLARRRLSLFIVIFTIHFILLKKIHSFRVHTTKSKTLPPSLRQLWYYYYFLSGELFFCSESHDM